MFSRSLLRVTIRPRLFISRASSSVSHVESDLIGNEKANRGDGRYL
jgi:hypothetical protein